MPPGEDLRVEGAEPPTAAALVEDVRGSERDAGVRGLGGPRLRLIAPEEPHARARDRERGEGRVVARRVREEPDGRGAGDAADDREAHVVRAVDDLAHRARREHGCVVPASSTRAAWSVRIWSSGKPAGISRRGDHVTPPSRETACHARCTVRDLPR